MKPLKTLNEIFGVDIQKQCMGPNVFFALRGNNERAETFLWALQNFGAITDAAEMIDQGEYFQVYSTINRFKDWLRYSISNQLGFDVDRVETNTTDLLLNSLVNSYFDAIPNGTVIRPNNVRDVAPYEVGTAEGISSWSGQ